MPALVPAFVPVLLGLVTPSAPSAVTADERERVYQLLHRACVRTPALARAVLPPLVRGVRARDPAATPALPCAPRQTDKK